MKSVRKRIYLSVAHLEECDRRYIADRFASRSSDGNNENLEALEADFSRLVGPHCVALSSGTAALHLAVKSLGLPEGAEIISPTLTFVASCNPILYERAIPIFIDSEYASWNLDANILAEFLKKRARVNRLPRAVIVVHLFGQSADLAPILETCRHYGLFVIEDAAEALGALYHGKPVGSFGDAGIYSFNGNKIITGTAGGMLVSPNEAWVEKARYWSNQARRPGLDYVHTEIGYNYRLGDLAAGVIRSQLERLEERVARRRAIAFRYRDALEEMGFTLMPQAPHGRHTNWLSCFLIDEKRFGLTQRQLIDYLESHNVESRPVWRPMHLQELYQSFECIGGAVAEDLNRRGICLPSSSNLSEEDQQFVIDLIQAAHRRRSLL